MLDRDLSNPEPRDADLIADIARGDMTALEQIVRRHQHKVRALAYRITGHWELADDVAQEAFLRVLRAAATYQPTASFTTWIYRIVVNLCLDARRRRSPLQLVAEETDCDSAPSVDQQLMHQETAAAVQREVALLPERQRIAIVLHRFDGLNHGQISQVTGWSEPAIESLLVRAYARLRERLRQWAEL